MTDSVYCAMSDGAALELYCSEPGMAICGFRSSPSSDRPGCCHMAATQRDITLADTAALVCMRAGHSAQHPSIFRP